MVYDKINNIYMISLGCPKNQVDGEIMLNKLAEANFQIVGQPEKADIVIVNTCGFIDSAKSEAIETILEMAQYKAAGIISAIVVTGCLAERYKDEVMAEIPEVDAVVGIGANTDIVKVCQKAVCNIKTNFFPGKCLLPLSGKRYIAGKKYSVYIKLSDGCDNNCSFCAIPSIRGEYRERPMEDIIFEANQLVEDGAREIILIAQDTTKYGCKLYGKSSLHILLKKLCKIDKLRWIRVYYCYPERITQELIDVIASEKKICSYIDIPMQHCCEHILKSMHRSGNYDSYINLIKKLRSSIPNITIRTTLMVGFPGESEEDFEQLCNFVKEAKFDKMGSFEFCPEEGTPAYSMPCQIDDDIKSHRADILEEIQYTVTQGLNKKKIGKTFEVLVDNIIGVNEYIGRAYFDSPEIDSSITFTSDKKIEIGSFVNVKITNADGYDLKGYAVMMGDLQ